MGNIQDLSDLISKSSGGASGAPESLFFFKNARIANAAATAPIAGRLTSLWRYEGTPSHGEIPPTAGEVPTKDTSGAMTITNASAGFTKWLTQSAAGANVAGTILLYDRLYHESGLVGNVTTIQNVQTTTPTPPITRWGGASSNGNFMFYEIYTAVGATPTTLSAEYIDTNGNISSGTATIGGTGFAEATRAQIIGLASGDKGLSAVTKIALGASTGTAGNFGIVIGKPIAWIPISVAGSCGWRDFTTGLPGIPKIENDACLALLWYANTTTAPEIFGTISTIQA